MESEGLDGPAAVAWLRILSELRRALEGMERLDLASRHVELEEEKADIVVTAFRAALEVLSRHVQLLPEDRELVTRTFLKGLGSKVYDDEDDEVPAIVHGEVEDDA